MLKREKRDEKMMNMRISESFRNEAEKVKTDFIKKGLAEYSAPCYLILNELVARYKKENDIE